MARPSITEEDRMYLAVERVLDGYRRGGVAEGAITALLERAWRASRELQATAPWRSDARRR